MKFTDYRLHPHLIKALEELKFETPTPIQDQSIPLILAGKDLAGLAQTGTGKTGAFLLPLIDRVLRSREKAKEDQKGSESWREEPKEGETPEPKEEAIPEAEVQAAEAEITDESHRPLFANWQPRNFILVLVPTRELAEQVQSNTLLFTKGTDLSSVAVYGGTSYEKQKSAFEKGVDFVIATPGRLIDLYKEHFVDLKQVRAVVFDEADRMFDMGFKDDMKYILRRIPQERQFLVYSATLNFDVLNTAYEFGADPIEINVSRDRATAEHVSDQIFHVGHHEKPAYLLSILRRQKPKQAIIFSNFKRNVERIAVFLNRNQVPTVGISSLLTQAQRNRVMEQFKGESEQNILVATDVAARGLDILGVDLVINFELPDDPENYVHRIGRTGRAGQEGHAYSLVSDRDVDALSRIQNYVNRKLDTGWMEDADLVKEYERFPAERDVDPMRPPRREGRESRDGGGRGRPRGNGRGGDRFQKGEGRRDRPPRAEGRRPGPDRGEARADNRTDARPDQPSRQEARAPRQERSRSPHRDRPPRAANGADNSTHRDRKTGRHQQQQQATNSNHANGGSKPSAGRREVRKPRRYTGRRPQRTPAPPPPASLGQKVSGFFKKLFGQ
jgi:ATP-dependent RNA helicase RhlB